MAEENIENQEQEKEEKVQHSLGEVIQLLNKISSINMTYSVASKALHSKQKKLAKAQLREQAKADAVVVCEKYKLGKEEEAKAVEEAIAHYDEEFEKISAEFEAKEESIRAEHEKNDNEYEEVLVKEAEARKAYRQERRSKEYKDFIAKNRHIDKDIKRYEEMKESANANIDPESLDKILAGLKELASKNPLNQYAEDMKKCEERKKEIIAANKELESKMVEAEDNFEKAWDELDVNKNKALVETKNPDLVKPTLGQRLSNFFTSQAKRREKAKIESKQKREARIESIKEKVGSIGTGIVGIASGAKKKIKDWHENNKQKRMDAINTLHAKLTANYQASEEKMDNLRTEVNKFVEHHTIPVPEAKAPIIENEGVEIEVVEENTVGRRPGSTASKEPEKKAEPATHEDR